MTAPGFAPRTALRTLLLLAGFFSMGGATALPADAWSINEALLPEGLSLEIVHRTRYEFLNDEFRTAGRGDTDVIASRTLIHGRLDLPLPDFLSPPHAGPGGIVTFGAELMDSRAEQNADTLLNTTIVNPVELLRAYVGLRTPGILGGTLEARAGRITMDFGSRRFVARNRYRNTINGFTGIDLEWKGGDDAKGVVLRGFWTLPVLREPRSRKRLLDNDVVFDTESTDVQFWGLFGARDFGTFGRGEIFVFGLHESDSRDRPTRNRKLVTPGFRFFRSPARNQLDYVFESAVQTGRSRATAGSTATLDHLAHFHHVEFGYSFDAPFSPRLALQYDYASGDAKPTDDQNGRFDTLFGARRFDFGPTGIYGAFARSNLHSPGIRLQTKLHPQLTSFIATRAFLLASDKDTWTTSGLRDASGRAGHHVGTQAEIRFRWQIVPENVMLETGYAHLFAGDFIDDAPNSNRQGDSDYVYSSIQLAF